MNDEMSEWKNELMEEEDAMIQEMKEEFKIRFKKRLQQKIEAKEAAMPEVQKLKKNAPYNENCEPPSES